MSFRRDLFGPSRDEIWQQFTAAVGGSFSEGGFWKGGKVEAAHGQWTVTLDTYTGFFRTWGVPAVMRRDERKNSVIIAKKRVY